MNVRRIVLKGGPAILTVACLPMNLGACAAHADSIFSESSRLKIDGLIDTVDIYHIDKARIDTDISAI